ncbi:MAG: hypothetical protein AB7J94_06085 [Geobacter sp.]
MTRRWLLLALAATADKGRLTTAKPIVYRFSMQSRHQINWLGSTLVLLALLSVLLAPVVAVCHTGQATAPAAMADQQPGGCDDCDDHQSQPDDDGCCSSSACSCACHAPLTSTVMFPPTPLFSFEPFREVTHRLPVVYLTIFVPPQNRS